MVTCTSTPGVYATELGPQAFLEATFLKKEPNLDWEMWAYAYNSQDVGAITHLPKSPLALGAPSLEQLIPRSLASPATIAS